MSTAAISASETAAASAKTPLPLRPDTFFGVCQAVGEDLGFHPNFLRIPFGALLLWNPVVTIGGYVGLGIVVAVTRWLLPDASESAVDATQAAIEPEAAEVAEVREPEEELLAA